MYEEYHTHHAHDTHIHELVLEQATLASLVDLRSREHLEQWIM
jgi:hypothetical protein